MGLAGFVGCGEGARRAWSRGWSPDPNLKPLVKNNKYCDLGDINEGTENNPVMVFGEKKIAGHRLGCGTFI